MAPYSYRNADDPDDEEAFVDKLVTELEELIEREGADTIAAMIGEPVQGAGGVVPPPDSYWMRMKEVLDANDILLIADEVSTGFGRTGKMFGVQQYGVQPDIVSIAKGVTSGYIPLGAVGVTDEIHATMLEPDAMFMHGFTYSGHPVACAVGLKNIDIIEGERLDLRADETGPYLIGRLEELLGHQNVGDVRGKGMMMIVEVVKDKDTKEAYTAADGVGARLTKATRDRGVIVRAGDNGISIAPPLVLTRDEADRVASAVQDSIVEVFG
jgi:adenosylmethionine-8-amino-7-oxononanoate aminotransferase